MVSASLTLHHADNTTRHYYHNVNVKSRDISGCRTLLKKKDLTRGRNRSRTEIFPISAEVNFVQYGSYVALNPHSYLWIAVDRIFYSNTYAHFAISVHLISNS